MAIRISQSFCPSLPHDVALDELAELKIWLAQMAHERTEHARFEFARAVIVAVVGVYWRHCCTALGSRQTIREAPVELSDLTTGKHLRFADICSTLPSNRAFFEIGELYTALLPVEHRARHGVYYTPPELVSQLLDLVTAEGIDWKTARVLDPSCGGAAFLAYLAERMLAQSSTLSGEERLRDLEQRLTGLEIDPFAAWLSAVLLDIVTLPVSVTAGRKLRPLVRNVDTLEQANQEKRTYDLVVGNPPYGKITLTPETRASFSRSLFGHANLYGLFTDVAVHLCRPGGLIAYVTPTSFLGGEYFKNLRKLLSAEAPLKCACFIHDRDGVFSGVLQETMLAIFRRETTRKSAIARVKVDVIHPKTGTAIEIKSLGPQTLGINSHEPWVLPRTPSQARLVRILNRLPARLSDYGYHVATGQLVWNRHKQQLRSTPGTNRYPILWAEAIQSNGAFVFQAKNRNHSPYLQLEEHQDFLVNHEPCILVQRTTSKEQSRRLIATVVPNEFIIDHPGYVVENHVNMVVPSVKSPAVSLQLMSRLLNSKIVDDAFRCISGSVAVSAYEMESLPLPDLKDLLKATRGRLATCPASVFESTIEHLYDGS